MVHRKLLGTNHDPTKFGQSTSNHETDLCQIYGLSEQKTTMLRAHVGGRLASQLIDGDEYPEYLFEPRTAGGPLVIKERFRELHNEDFLLRAILGDVLDERKDSVFAVGLEHGYSTIGNTIMDVLFLREHNRVAAVLPEAYPEWDDERPFQTTRNVMIVIMLNPVVQREAEVQAGGKHLGAVGSRVVAEVFVGLLEGDKNSFLSKQKDWKPTLPSASTGRFTMADLLNFVGDLNPLG